MFEKKRLLFLAHSDNALVPMAEDAQKRASMQDWRSFPYFLTAEVWSSLCSAQCSQLKKVDALVKHLVSMGLRNPSEMTQGLIAAVIGRHELDDLLCVRARVVWHTLLGCGWMFYRNFQSSSQKESAQDFLPHMALSGVTTPAWWSKNDGSIVCLL